MRMDLFFPLRFFIYYISFTIFIFAFGPWEWPARSTLDVYFIMMFVMIFMYIGYHIGIKTQSRAYYGRFSVIDLYRVSVFLSLVLFWPTLIWRTSGISIAQTFLDFGEAYKQSHDVANVVTGQISWIEYIRIFLSVFLNLPILILVTSWERLTRVERSFGILSILLDVFLSVVIGTNKGFGDVLIYIFWAFIIRVGGVISTKMLRNGILFILPVFIAFFIIFTQGQIDRHNGFGVQDEFHSLGIVADRQSVVVKYLPSSTQEGVIAFSSYLTQGYQGLYYCLELPFVPSWGAGNSRFLAAYYDKYLGTNVEDNTYPMRAEKTAGWDSKVNWHSMLPWFASDVTFVGSVFLVGFFAALMAMVWRDAITVRNPYAMSIFAQLAVMFLFISANNQAFQSGGGVVGFIITLFCWIFTRRKIVWN